MTARGYVLGERTILTSMLLGEGECRVAALADETRELDGDVIAQDAATEFDIQQVQ